MPDSIKTIKQDLTDLLEQRCPDKRKILALLKRAHALGKTAGGGAEEIEGAARQWVLAEVMFRLGPQAYSDPATQLYIKAEESLRAAVSGTSDLVAAAEALGIPLTHLIAPTKRPRKRRRA